MLSGDSVAILLLKKKEKESSEHNFELSEPSLFLKIYILYCIHYILSFTNLL